MCFIPQDLAASGPADVCLLAYQGGFGLGVLHLGMRITGAADHVVGPVVDPLPLPLVVGHERVEGRPISRDGERVGGLDRVLVYEFEQVFVHMFVYYLSPVT